jgi:alpha-tubulin suppressor-like RCC1 family protein
MPFNVDGGIVITDDRIINNANGLVATRPTSPIVGMLFFNSTDGVMETYDGASWVAAGPSSSGSVAYAWGSNSNGKLGDNTTSSRSSPVSVVGDISDWVQLSSGGNHSLGLRANGTAWAWGLNSFGQLGDNTITSRRSPVSVVGGYTDWKQVSAGYSHSLGIRANGTAWAWGRNLGGSLGDSTTTSRRSPVSVVGGYTDWVQVDAGGHSNLGLRADGTLWAWGRNVHGELGDNTTSSRLSPVSVVGGITDWVQVSVAIGQIDLHSIAIRADGTAWSWGSNFGGKLGDGTTNNTSSPVSVVGGYTDWKQVSAATSHSLGIRANGTAWAWGYNTSGQLGDNTTSNRSSPVSVVGGFTDWISVAAGEFFSIGERANGTAWAWGFNSSGQLGDTTTSSRQSPIEIAGNFTDWVSVTAGDTHALAIRIN